MTPLHDASQTQQNDPFASLYPHMYMLLTTYRKTGVGIPTLVGFAHQGGKIYVMTPGKAGKLKRLRANGHVTLTPCKGNGEALGKNVEGQARILASEEQAVAHRAFVRKHRVIYSIYLLTQKMLKAQPTYIEIQPVQS